MRREKPWAALCVDCAAILNPQSPRAREEGDVGGGGEDVTRIAIRLDRLPFMGNVGPDWVRVGPNMIVSVEIVFIFCFSDMEGTISIQYHPRFMENDVPVMQVFRKSF